MIQDIPKLYTALAEWLSCLGFILLLKRRFSDLATIVYSVMFLALLCIIQFLIGIAPLPLWMPGMALALLVMYVYIFLCCNISTGNAGFIWAFAFIFAEFAASLEWQISSFLFSLASDFATWQELLLMFVSFGVIYSVFFYLEKKRLQKVKELRVTLKVLFSAALIAVSAFLLSNISYVYKDTPFSGSMTAEIFYIRTLVDFGGVVMLMSLEESFIGFQVERERDSIHNILLRQYENYQQSRENITLINQKYHDLKHQIEIIRRESSQEKRDEYINEIQNGISDFEAQNKTGNGVLDTILTNKQLYCMQHQINLTNVVDGSLLNFMEVMDLCSIFGNALDNAIESVEKIEDPSKRLIRMAVYKQNNLLMMRFENYYEGTLMLKDKLPQPTKNNDSYHGFGIKSICYTAEKYGGTAAISTEDSWFLLSVLVPLPQEQNVED